MIGTEFDNQVRELIERDIFYSLKLVRASGPRPSVAYVIKGWGMEAEAIESTIIKGGINLKVLSDYAESLGLYQVPGSPGEEILWHVPRFSFTIMDDGGGRPSDLSRKLRREAVPHRLVPASKFDVLRGGVPFRPRVPESKPADVLSLVVSWISEAAGHCGRGLAVPNFHHLIAPLAEAPEAA